ncbi:MAG: ABC transporter ATP-binding protein [bacterium]|nr:ABC transporter ATP-binding protein [Myxococcales bacterium]MCB9543395.1 ABC transporter ATP-binding protein [Myxococcales bacterium]
MPTHALTVDGLKKTFDLGFLGALPGFGRLAARLQVKGIAHRVEAVRGIHLEVEPGEIFGFLGPNGAGKTTTIKMLMGLIHPTAGSGTLLGHPLGHREARARLGFLPEHPYFYEHLAPVEFLDFYGRLFRLTARERKQRAEALIERVGLGHARGRPLRKFSKGMIQRIGIAQALINDPDLVVLDEPMSGLDPMGRKDVRDIIFELKEAGKTVFLSSHILQDVEMICDRVAIVVKGRVRSAGDLATLLDTPTHRVEIAVAGLAAAATAALAARATGHRTVAGQERFTVTDEADVNDFVQAAITAGGRLVAVQPERKSLEELFVAEAKQAEGEA